MNELLACCPDLDGVWVCVTDTVALKAMRALRAAGRAIGTQVSLGPALATAGRVGVVRERV